MFFKFTRELEGLHRGANPQQPGGGGGGDSPSVRTAVGLLLALRRGEAADPFGLLGGGARPLLASLHGPLRAACAPYAACTLAAAEPRVWEEPGGGGGGGGVLAAALEQDLVCLQWRECDPGQGGGGPGGGGLREWVEGYLVLGQTAARGEAYGEPPA